MVDILDQVEVVACPPPKSSSLVDVAQERNAKMTRKLTELARYFQKTSVKVPSTQPTEVLVRQVLQQVEEGGDTITFAIPYNPSFIGLGKTREEDGLDKTTRVSLENIYIFANQISEITGKKVSFILLYDSALSLGICEQDILKPEDYLVGVQAIHRYTGEHNTGRVQIREFDTASDTMLGHPQKPGFIESSELESAYMARLENSQRIFSEKERISLREFVACQIAYRQIKAHPGEIRQTYDWLHRTLDRENIRI